jgi:hypothetical protein
MWRSDNVHCHVSFPDQGVSTERRPFSIDQDGFPNLRTNEGKSIAWPWDCSNWMPLLHEEILGTLPAQRGPAEEFPHLNGAECPQNWMTRMRISGENHDALDPTLLMFWGKTPGFWPSFPSIQSIYIQYDSRQKRTTSLEWWLVGRNYSKMVWIQVSEWLSLIQKGGAPRHLCLLVDNPLKL